MTTTTGEAAAANVVAIRPGGHGDPRSGDARVGAVAPLVVAALVLAALDGGLYEFTRWGLMAAAMLAILAGLLIAGKIETLGPLTPTVLAIVALAAWSALSMLWADSADRAWTESNRLVLYAAVMAICVVALRSRRDAHRGLAIVGALIAAAALYAVALLLRGDPAAFLDHRLDTPIGYINGTAGLFLMGLWPLVSLAERASNPWVAGGAIALAVVEASLLLLTQSRAIIPALIVSTCLLVALYPGRVTRVWALLFVAAGTAAASPWALAVYADRVPGQPRPVPDDLARTAALAALAAAVVTGAIWSAALLARRTRSGARGHRAAARGAAAVVVCVTAAVLVAAGDPVQRVEREWRAFATLQVDESTTQRFTGAGGYRHDLWRVALADARREPLLGVGAGSYGLSYYQQRRQLENVRQPHSLPLQVASELGLVGAVLLLVAFAAALRALVRAREVSVAAGVAGTGIAASWATQTSVDWLYNLPGLTCIAIVGLVAACASAPRPPPSAGRRRRLLSVAAALAIAVAAASIGRHYIAGVYAGGARDALADGDPAAALRKSDASLQINPYAIETYYTQAAAYARFDDYARAQHMLMQAASREPLNFVPWALRGDLAVRRGEIATARRSYARSLALNPRDPVLRELAADPRRAAP